MESQNEAAKLIAQALELLKYCKRCTDVLEPVDESIPLLEQALDKLTNKM